MGYPHFQNADHPYPIGEMNPLPIPILLLSVPIGAFILSFLGRSNVTS